MVFMSSFNEFYYQDPWDWKNWQLAALVGGTTAITVATLGIGSVGVVFLYKPIFL